MTPSDIPSGETGSLNVASDATTIYEGGKLIPLNITDLLNNEVALRQLINSLNLANREIERLKSDIELLKLERAATMAQPALAVFLAVVNICGAVLVAVGVNYVTAEPPVRGGWGITIIGSILTIVTAIGPIILPSLIDHFRKQRNAH